jgi:nicotinamidase-related amidase
MILQPAQGRLTANNCAFILMDYQPQIASTISSIDGDALIHNATNLAKIAKTFNIPTVLTTIGQASFGGPIFQELQDIFPHQKPINRTTLGVFEDNGVLTALEKMGRNKLVIGGLWTDFGVAASAAQALKTGYELYIVIDACGDISARAHEMALKQIIQNRAILMTWLQIFLTLHREWAPPDAYETLLRIAREHAGAHGLDLKYGEIFRDEGQTKFGNDNKPKEGRWGKWSIAPVRSLRRFQKRL